MTGGADLSARLDMVMEMLRERWGAAPPAQEDFSPRIIVIPPMSPRRKPNRSRRIVKKLLKRADDVSNFTRDAVSVDGGKRWVTGVELRHHGLRWKR